MADKPLSKIKLRKGALTRWAASRGIKPPFTEAKLNRLRSIAMRLPKGERTRRLRQINLARTFRRLRKK